VDPTVRLQCASAKVASKIVGLIMHVGRQI
jgi:hypothetical protein